MTAISEFSRKTFSSLSVRNYRLYFIGQGISQCGTWMQTVALGWLVLTLTGSGTQLGFVLALQFLPILVAAPWGGVFVDRFNKRRILYWTQSISGILSLIVSILVFTGLIQVWMLYALALIAGTVKVFDNPARQTFISEIVGNEHVKNAISLNSTMVNLARAIGPTIAGIIIASVGLALCFLVDAISYIAVLFMLTRMRGAELEREPVMRKRPHLLSGLRYVQQNALLSTILIMMAIVGTFAYEFAVSLPILAQQTFLGNASSYAALTSAFGIGSAVGGLYAASRQQVAPHQLVIFTFLFGASMIVASVSPTLQLAIIALLIVGFFSINVTSLANTTIQLESEPEMRGRVMAFWNMAIFGSTPIGGPIIGWIGDHLGARWSLATGGAATVFAAFYALTLLRRDRSRNVPTDLNIRTEEAAAENAKL